MKRHTRQVLAVCLATVLLLCSGCSLDVEQFLRPPKAQGEQQAVQTALETYIRDSGQGGNRYTLSYPVEGEHTSAFVLCTADGKPLDGTDENAALALAFYTMAAAPNDTHINLLRRQGNEWVSVADVVGASADILQVAFGDLDGDGIAEMMTGWDTYNSRDHRLTVFSLAQGLTRLADDRTYNRLFVGKFNEGEQDSLLLVRIATGEVTATLETVKNNALVSRGQVMLDAEIRQINSLVLCRLTDGVNGLYVDAVKGTNTAVTELIYFDGERLCAPFCNQAARVNTITARPVGFAMRDVDGDGTIDVPRCTLLEGYGGEDSTADYAYRTDWCVWNYTTGQWSVKLSSVVNAADGYLVALDDNRKDTITTTYLQSERLLTLLDTQSMQPLMRLRPMTEESDDGYVTLFKQTDGYDGCEVWFDETKLDMDTVRYMVSRLTN